MQELNVLLAARNEKTVFGPDAKKWLTQGKVVISSLMGDKAILKAMLTNEEDTNIAYKRMEIHKGIWNEAKDILSAGYDDEKRHKSWLEERIL